MRKISTLLFVVMSAIAVHATDYNVPITVTVNGVSSDQTGVITIVENNGLYDLTLKNFMLQSENGPMGVGNVELTEIKPYQDGTATLLTASKQVTITDGDAPGIQVWMASMLPPVNVILRGKIEGERLRCYLDIDMTESLQQVIQVAIGGGYQLPNPSFEAWHSSSGNYVEPNAWHSFESATGSMASLAGHHIEKSSDAHSGEASARIYATSIFGVIANGTMTTGRMNAGAMVASNTANNAYLDMSKTDVDGNGDPYYVPLYSRPDSIVAWVKFKQGTANSAHPYATISAVITDGTYYQDPEDKTYSNIVAKAKNNQIATTDNKWVRISLPFVYTENAVDPKAVLITISTNADPGQGSANDEVLVDDIAFIYNIQVTGLKIKGQDVPDFSSEKTSYEIELDQEITADDIEVAVEGKSIHVIKSATKTTGGYNCMIDAISADMSEVYSYTVMVKDSSTGIRNMHPAAKQPITHYTLDGRQVQVPLSGHIYISRHANGTITKSLR